MQAITKIATLSALSAAALHASPNVANEDRQPIGMPISIEVSPNGSEILLAWKNDIWRASITGGKATRVTTHPANEFRPIYAPDGKSLFFNSTRGGATQVWKKNLASGAAKLVTRHTEASILEDISLDGKTLLLRNVRTHNGRNPLRLYTAPVDNADNESLLFDTPARGGKLSPDGKQLLLTRETVEPYRKQYKGTQAGQIWLYDKASKKFTQPVKSEYGVRYPLWADDGKGFYYVSQQDLTFNLYFHDLKTKKSKQLTFFKDDGVIAPTISDDGSTIVFKVLLDLYTLKTTAGAKPKKIELYSEEVDHEDPIRKVASNKTKEADFTPSGLEIAFTSNDDLYVMDTVLREPVEIGRTPEVEKNVIFVKKGKEIYYIKDDGIKTSICRVKRKDPTKFWWDSSEFTHETVFESKDTLIAFNSSPDGKKLSITTVSGKMIITDIDGKNPKTIVSGWDKVYASWSPDSKWIAYSQQDNNFNSDIYITKADGSQKPINLSQHPDNEYAPSWSPDGKKIVFMGRRFGSSYDLFVADLFPKEKSSREKKIESAKKAMAKDPSYKKAAKVAKAKTPAKDPKLKIQIVPRTDDSMQFIDADKPEFNLKGITKRFKRIKLSGSLQQLGWSHDSKKLLVQHRGGKEIYAYPATGGKPTKFAAASGPFIRTEKSGKIFMINNGQPAVLSGGRATNYGYTVYSERDRRDAFRMAFRMAWRTMGDGFYDTAMNNRDWDAVLKKFDDAAYNAANSGEMERLVEMMLGELNASHTGFQATPWKAPYKAPTSREKVIHLGAEYDKSFDGPGFLINAIVPNSSATQEYSKLHVGDTILKVNGKSIDKKATLVDAFLLVPSKEVELTVKNAKGKERKVNIAPMSYKAVSALKGSDQIDQTQAMVDKLSDGKLGYIHIKRMMWDEFEKFERHIYEKGYGKDGLIIDVRNNGGGFTTDHLLTALNQKRHAFTIPRNGGAGYPQDRIVYATWDKPIIVLTNQNSFSNAEIFAHAIKTLKRGKVIGVQTAGGVISTGSKSLPNAGTLRFPFRGWFLLNDGADMEMNGAMPDITIWPTPEEEVKGIDKQLEKAVEVLQKEVKTTKPTHGDAIYKSTLSK